MDHQRRNTPAAAAVVIVLLFVIATSGTRSIATTTSTHFSPSIFYDVVVLALIMSMLMNILQKSSSPLGRGVSAGT
jgi:hypothetical protein